MRVPKIIVIGSTNPVKIKAVKRVINQIHGSRVDYLAVEADSGVSHQPFSDKETRQGAINRAYQALQKQPQAHWGVGLEGGVRMISYARQGRIINEVIEVAWCAITDKTGRLTLGGGAQFQLPPVITNRLKKGEELGPIMDDLLNDTNVKKKQGAIGTLSNNLLTRQDIYEHLVKLALVKFISQAKQPNWWLDKV